MRTLAFDLETTSLMESRLKRLEFQPYVTQFVGWLVDLNNGEILESLETYVRPPRADVFNTEAIKATGIDWEKVKDKHEFISHAVAIKTLIERSPSVAAHNLVFDRDVLDVEMRRCGMSLRWPSRQICTIEATSHLEGRRLSLTDLHKKLIGEDFEGAHDARNDVAALVRCLVELRHRDWI